ncbi:MAG: lysophospholipid acyltransferase family protein [Chloroflexi bacterium]|nr:lysophospholipid acyltransferase family protein [Chloroflexota bacterium]
MKTQNIVNGAFGVGFAIFISKILPRKVGHRVAIAIGSILARSKTLGIIPALRTNQWVISGQSMNSVELDNRVKTVFKSTATCLFDFYHFLNHPKAIINRVEFDPKIAEYFDPRVHKNAVFVAPHLSNFDLLGQALGIMGYTFQILSYSEPGRGYQWQNKIRTDSGQIITPTSISALRQARSRLQNGGNVLTGLDRPVDSLKFHPLFFGYPASLPVAYAHLALQANVPVVVVSAITKPDGNYFLYASDPVKMVSTGDAYGEAIRNAEAVLEVAAEIITKYPEQWSMFYPVWPQFMPANSETNLKTKETSRWLKRKK